MERNAETIVAAAMAFPMGRVLDKYILTHQCSLDEARNQERELKRFLSLCAIGGGKARYGIGKPVDDLWHEFILFTKLYSDFCTKVAGRAIHHQSRMPGATRPEADVLAMHAKFLADYQEVFGEEAPAKYWHAMHECSHVEPEVE